MALRKGDTVLLNALNREIDKFVGSPEYNRIYIKWYGRPASFWTIEKVVAVSGAVIFLIAAGMAIWRYIEIKKLNRALEKSFQELRQTDAALQESSAKMLSVFRSAPVGIGVVVNRIITEANNRLCMMTGYSRDELLGQSSIILYPDKKEYDFVGAEKYRQIMETGTGTVETLWKTKDGAIRNVLLSSSPIDQGDFSKGVTFSALDITKRLQTEAEKEKLKELLLQSQKMEAVGQLAGGIAHDFNNILCSITGFADLLKLTLRGNIEAEKYVSEILRAADRAASLTQGLLAFSRKQPSNPAPIDLNVVIRNTEMMLARAIGEDIRLKLMLTEGSANIFADSNQMVQILLNLAANARDAMPNGGELTIGTSIVHMDEAFTVAQAAGMSGPFVLMTITDTGSGMDDETRARIFEPFFTTKDVGKGTGLGLAMVYGIVQQHNGFIDVHSELDKGAAFKIYLPSSEMKDHPCDEFSSEACIPMQVGLTILLAEDDAMVRRALAEILGNAGQTVIEAGDGAEAVAIFSERMNEIDLALIDVIMPLKGGGEAYKELKAKNPDLKIILMSGYAGDYLTGKLGIQDDVDFISKPIAIKDLLRKISVVMGR